MLPDADYQSIITAQVNVNFHLDLSKISQMEDIFI